jgi:thiamine transport system substrate-binding protein
MGCALGLVLALGGCGDDEGGSNASATLETFRPVEPVTVTLLAHGAWAASDGIFDPLLDEGIEVKVITGQDAGALTDQVVLDREHPQADVVYGIDNTFLGRALANDVFARHEYDVSALQPELLAQIDTELVVPIDYGDVCVNYDIDWFASRDIAPPDSIDDLIDPTYDELTVVQDPNVSSPGLAFLLATVTRHPDGWPDYWRALVDNGVLVVDGWTTAWTLEFTAGGGDGDRPIVVSYASSPPADVIYSDPPRVEPNVAAIDDGCFRQVEYAGVLRNAVHDAAAAKVVQFLTSERFQTDVPTNMFVFPARDGVELPEVFLRFALQATDPVLLAVDEADARRDDVIDRWTEIVLS